MPRLSLYRPNKTSDYKFLDNTIREMYTAGGIDIFVHKYVGPKIVGDSANREGHEGADITRPLYDEQNPLNIEDLFFLENRDREYEDDVYTMRGVYNVQDIDFDLTQFGLFLAGDTLFVTFHYNDMIDTFGRKLMAGDVIEVPNLRDFHPLDTSGPKALPRYYVVQDAGFGAEGFSQTWQPHLWRVKVTPLQASQEYNDILTRPLDPDNPDSGTIEEFLSHKAKNLEINDAIIQQAEIEVPKSGYDNSAFYITPTINDEPVPSELVQQEDSSTTGPNAPKANGYLVGYLTGDGVAPNGLNVTPGTSFPLNPAIGDFALRLDFVPNRLFRYNGNKWVKIEDNVRTNLTPGASKTTQHSKFVNNTGVVQTTDRGNIPARQALSDLLKPKKDN